MPLVALAHHALVRVPRRRAFRDAVAILSFTALAALVAQQCDLVALQRSAFGQRSITAEEALILGNLFTVGLVVFCFRRFLDERRVLVRSLAMDASDRTTARAFTDLSTGISNRRHLELECREALLSGGDATLLLVELAGADDIREDLGTGEADRVMAILARRLRAAIDTSDVVAHLEGHVFAVLAKAGAGPEIARSVGAIVAHAVGEPVLVDRRSHRLVASIGATSLNPLDQEGEALRRADVALARARGKGRSAISFFDSALQAA